MRFFIIFLIPLLLYGNLTNFANNQKEIALLNSFDIEPSFLYDPIMNQMRNKNNAVYKNNHFFKAMEEAYLFIPTIKQILIENDIPLEFLYLVMAESNFSNKAYSNKRASGLWQFMPETGKLYGLKIDEYVDERRDPIKSTVAAAKFLTDLHKRFGKWYLAAIAYNCGGGRLNRAITQAGNDDLKILLDKDKKYIPKESRFYIRKIVALALVGYDEDYMLESEYEYLLNRASAYSIAKVNLASGESLRRVSKLTGIPLSELHKLNRHLKYDFVPPYKGGYDIYIPYIKLSDFKQKYTPDKVQNIYKIHVVTSGDNLYNIGRQYNVSYKVIMDFNKMKSSKLSLKQRLVIPIEQHMDKVKTNSYYMVRKGDTLESIAKSYRISVENIKLQNRLTTNILKIGDRLKLYE
ncbi:MAG: transglycosylase SLT domain-containing protein [Sulfurimonadaceae bacterium]|jgi:membrane-bound lytic murein transglycosylase D|nr:transglycosylase SLT domain-containing protein [Sulfurimonadaceae bacterium]